MRKFINRLKNIDWTGYWLAVQRLSVRLTARDKLMHCLGGVVLFIVIEPLAGPVVTEFIVGFVGYIKEKYDERYPDIHTAERLDWMMTALGGLLGRACVLAGAL